MNNKRKQLYEKIMRSLSVLVSNYIKEAMEKGDFLTDDKTETDILITDTDNNVSRKVRFYSRFRYMGYMYIVALNKAVKEYFDGLTIKFINQSDADDCKRYIEYSKERAYSTDVHQHSLVEQIGKKLERASNLDELVKILCGELFNDRSSINTIVVAKPIK